MPGSLVLDLPTSLPFCLAILLAKAYSRSLTQLPAAGSPAFEAEVAHQRLTRYLRHGNPAPAYMRWRPWTTRT